MTAGPQESVACLEKVVELVQDRSQADSASQPQMDAGGYDQVLELAASPGLTHHSKWSIPPCHTQAYTCYCARHLSCLFVLLLASLV